MTIYTHHSERQNAFSTSSWELVRALTLAPITYKSRCEPKKEYCHFSMCFMCLFFITSNFRPVLVPPVKERRMFNKSTEKWNRSDILLLLFEFYCYWNDKGKQFTCNFFEIRHVHSNDTVRLIYFFVLARLKEYHINAASNSDFMKTNRARRWAISIGELMEIMH